jgi:outer membrane receptor protein involved in Fe transport
MRTLFHEKNVRLLTAGFILLVFSAPLLGQAVTPNAVTNEERTVVLSVFEVTTDSDIGYQSTRAAAVTRMDTPIEDIPMNVTVLNQEFMEDTLARTMEDVLEYVPGFVPTSNNDAWVVRGFDNANTKFLNGFLQEESIGTVSIANIERVEVLKGPAAVLFGQGGYAATVNRVTKRPLGRPHTQIRGSYVSPLNAYRVELDHGGPIGSRKSPFRYRINAVYDDGEYWRKITHQEKAYAGAFSWQISEKTLLVLDYIDVVETDGGAVWRQPMWQGDPNGFTLADGTRLKYGNNRQGYAAEGDQRRWKRGFGMVDVQHVFNDNLQLRIQFSRDTKDQLYEEHQPEQGSLTFLKDAVLMPRRWRTRTQDVTNLRSRNELVAKFSTGPADHRVLVGISWDQSDGLIWNQDGFYNRGGLAANNANLNRQWPTASVGNRLNFYPNLTLAEFLTDIRLAGFNPNMPGPINVINPALSPRVLSEAERPPLVPGARNLDFGKNLEYYLADVVSFFDRRFFITGGIRQTETYSRRFNSTTQVLTSVGTADSTTYSTGTVWHIDQAKRFSFYANLNSSFRPEFRKQPDDTPLDPEEGNQKEVGLRYSLRDNKIQGMFSFYEIIQQNVAIDDASRDDGDWFTQIDGLRSRGFEATVNSRLTDNWSVMGGYAYTDSRDTTTGVRQIYSPYHMFTAFNTYRFREGGLKGLDLSLGSIYLGTRPIDPGLRNTLGVATTPLWTMPNEWRFDAVVKYKLPTRGKISYTMGLKVANLLDNQNIFKLADRVSYQRQPGRTYAFNLTAKF